jgi:glucokinase
MNRNATFAIVGLDIGGSKTAIVLGTKGGEIISRREIPTDCDRPFAETYPKIVTEIEDIIAYGKSQKHIATAISVAVGGPLRIEEGYIVCPPHLPGWHETPLKNHLAASFGLPVFVEHDGNAGALAEWYFGAGKGARNLIFLTAGTGLGAGIIIDGKIYRGASDTSGEVGHIRLSDDGPVSYGKQGSWEAYCSSYGIVQLAHLRFPDRWHATMSPKEFFDLVHADDPQALAVVTESGQWLGKGLSILIDIFNPDTIVIGSMGRVLGERWLAPAQKVIAQECLPETHNAVRIVPAALGKEIGDIASLMAAITQKQ